jgi:multidrug efflux system membrane fusion protein
VRGWSGGSDLQGKVREVAASADAVTRTYSVKVGIDAATSPPLGATAYARAAGLAHGGHRGDQAADQRAAPGRPGSAVWVLDRASMTVRSQQVQVATADGNEAVIASGIAPGMMVVAAGVHVLSPGQKVTIYQSKGPRRPPMPGAPGAKLRGGCRRPQGDPSCLQMSGGA